MFINILFFTLYQIPKNKLTGLIHIQIKLKNFQIILNGLW